MRKFAFTFLVFCCVFTANVLNGQESSSSNSRAPIRSEVLSSASESSVLLYMIEPVTCIFETKYFISGDYPWIRRIGVSSAIPMKLWKSRRHSSPCHSALKITHVVTKFFDDYHGVLKKNRLWPSSSRRSFKTEHLPLQLWISISVLYCIGVLFFICFTLIKLNFPILQALSFIFLGGAFLLHTHVLLLKNMIFHPLLVSTVLEASLCIAWLAVTFGFLISIFFKRKRFFVSSILSSAGFFTLMSIWDTQPAIVEPDFLLSKKWLAFFHEMVKSTGFVFLFLGSLVAHISFIMRKKFSVILQHCLYWGTFWIGLSILVGEIWLPSHQVIDWKNQEYSMVLLLFYYSLLVHFGNNHAESDVFRLGGCAGIGFLAWEEKKLLFFLGIGTEMTLDYLYVGIILLEMIFIISVLMRKKRRSLFSKTT